MLCVIIISSGERLHGASCLALLNMPMSDLPPEIILHVVEWLDYAYEMNNLARTTRTFHALLNPLLYAHYSRG